MVGIAASPWLEASFGRFEGQVFAEDGPIWAGGDDAEMVSAFRRQAADRFCLGDHFEARTDRFIWRWHFDPIGGGGTVFEVIGGRGADRRDRTVQRCFGRSNPGGSARGR